MQNDGRGQSGPQSWHLRVSFHVWMPEEEPRFRLHTPLAIAMDRSMHLWFFFTNRYSTFRFSSTETGYLVPLFLFTSRSHNSNYALGFLRAALERTAKMSAMKVPSIHSSVRPCYLAPALRPVHEQIDQPLIRWIRHPVILAGQQSDHPLMVS